MACIDQGLRGKMACKEVLLKSENIFLYRFFVGSNSFPEQILQAPVVPLGRLVTGNSLIHHSTISVKGPP